MAQLILTEAEQSAVLWTDLDDAALGALLRKKLAVLTNAAAQMDRTFTSAAALMLCCAAAEEGSRELVFEVDNLTQAGRAFGDWKVVAMRMGPEAESEPARARTM